MAGQNPLKVDQNSVASPKINVLGRTGGNGRGRAGRGGLNEKQ